MTQGAQELAGPSRGHLGRRNGVAAASLSALGVVYGDLGTSPLYTMQEASKAFAGHGPTAADVIALVSTIIWALIVVAGLKYAVLILRADNRGEGGIMAMLAILHARTVGASSRRGKLLLLTGLIGAALLYGDGTITPAISVLSAVEGLRAQAPALAPAVLPITVAVLALLFLVQRFGTAAIGGWFGPIMVGWFLSIAVLGAISVAAAPQILLAFNPMAALGFLVRSPLYVSALLVGGAFLALTGTEAMYADLGHFGAGAIRLAWFAIVMPSVMLCYLGQGAQLLLNPKLLTDPSFNAFWSIAPAWFHYPLVLLATVATVIASQSIITGAFSLTRQATQLGFLPPLRVVHTSASNAGQVYLPLVNVALAIGTIGAVLYFRSSAALGGAYGIAVSMLMVITTLLATLIARQWRVPTPLIVLANGSFLLIDLSFVAANSVKLANGGWFPLALAAAVALLMLTWHRGELLLARGRDQLRQSPDEWTRRCQRLPRETDGRTGAFLSRSANTIPLALSRLAELTGRVPSRILLVSLEMLDVPRAAENERINVRHEPSDVRRVALRYGFTDTINVPRAIESAVRKKLLEPAFAQEIVYYISSETVIPSSRLPGMSSWREHLFAFMHRNSERPGAHFCIPPSQVIDVGTEIEI